MKTLIAVLLFAFFTLSTHAQIITTIAGNGIQGYTGNGGQATDAEINDVSGIAVDDNGNVYFPDFNDNVIRMVNSSGIITTIAGNGTAGFSGDGGQATAASINFPIGIVIDKVGNLFFGDENNRRVRKINTAGIISTIAGNGDSSFTGDGGWATAATFLRPGIGTIDNSGNLYIVDDGFYHPRIRKITTLGIINTIAGTGATGYTGDGGPATDAEIIAIGGLEIDGAGNVYFSDIGANTVRKIDTNGIINTIAGQSNSGNNFFGDGGPATNAAMFEPGGIGCDWVGNLYIADSYNQRIRAINTAGIINTIAGDPLARYYGYYVGDYAGDGGPAILAQLDDPGDVVVDNCGNLYINDFDNHRIRKIWGAAAGVASIIAEPAKIQLFPNPNNGPFSVILPAGVPKATISVTDIVGKMIEIKTTQANGKVNVDLGNAVTGTYLVRVETESGVYREKVTIKK